jgi:hypothetical protein
MPQAPIQPQGQQPYIQQPSQGQPAPYNNQQMQLVGQYESTQRARIQQPSIQNVQASHPAQPPFHRSIQNIIVPPQGLQHQTNPAVGQLGLNEVPQIQHLTMPPSMQGHIYGYNSLPQIQQGPH